MLDEPSACPDTELKSDFVGWGDMGSDLVEIVVEMETIDCLRISSAVECNFLLSSV